MCRPSEQEAIPAVKQIDASAPPQKSRSSVASKALHSLAVLIVAISILLPILISEGASGWTKKYTSPGPVFKASDIGDLTGKVAIVTGSNTGIGYHTALELARNGADVIVAARSRSKGEASVSTIISEAQLDEENADRVQYMPLDLSSLKSIRTFANAFLKLKKPLHILVNNAGIMKSPGAQYVGKNLTYGFDLTQDGFESHIGINHIGHFYLTKLLTKKLKDSAPSRVVVVSSGAEDGAYPGGIGPELWRPADGVMSDEYEDGMAYGQSKLANLLFARELAVRMEGTGVTSYSCHPGIIASELGRYMEDEFARDASDKGPLAKMGMYVFGALFGSLFGMAQFSTADGALTQLQLATADAETLVNGAFYHPIGRVVESSHPDVGNGNGAELQKLLWAETERALKAL